MSEDIRYRQHRYLIMTGIRVLSFSIAIVLYVARLRWLVLVPAVGAIFIPYVAVVFANGGGEPDNVRGVYGAPDEPPGRARPIRRRPLLGRHLQLFSVFLRSPLPAAFYRS
jgi:hypothetical protein